MTQARRRLKPRFGPRCKFLQSSLEICFNPVAIGSLFTRGYFIVCSLHQAVLKLR